MPSCFFNKRPSPASPHHDLDYYREMGLRMIDELDGEHFDVLLDIQGRNFSVAYKPLGRAVETHADTAVDYWASIVEAIHQVRDIAATDVFKP